MDERPFFEFVLNDYSESDVEELKKFAKAIFNLDTIISTASNLKYTRGLVNEIRHELTEAPSEELVRVLCSRVYDGRFTVQVKEQFTVLVKKAFETFLLESINSKLKSAFAPERVNVPVSNLQTSENENQSSSSSGIDTTLEELEAHRIIQAIGAEITDVEHIVIRDAKSYCAILYDDNNRKPIARLYLTDLYKHKALLLQGIQQYLTD